MSETTKIITLEITYIAKTEEFKPNEEIKKEIESFFESSMGADDCHVTKIQDFEMDVKE